MIRPMTREDAEHVTLNMREKDWREIEPCLWIPDKKHLAEYAAANLSKMAWSVCAKKGDALGVFGLNITSPGVATAWMWATDKINCRAWLEVVKAGRSIIAAVLESGGINRVQANVAAWNDEGNGWLRRMGFGNPVEMKSTGRNGEDYFLVSILKPKGV